MIKDAWESTQSTSRSAFRMHKMAMKPFRRFNISMSMSLRDDTQCIVCFMFYTTFCCNCCIPWNVYKKIYVICIIRPPSGLRNSGHLILHLKKISLHIEWCSSCYLNWEWILLLPPLTHFYCIKFSSKSFKRMQHSFTLFIISTNNFNKQALHLSRLDLPSPHSCVLRLSIMQTVALVVNWVCKGVFWIGGMKWELCKNK